MAKKKNSSENESLNFSTLSGVFIPSVLAILGAVMYYILPQVLGGVGIAKMLFIIVIAHSITLATAFSIGAIATNINVKGGGLYYLISRSLGNEFGGSMGIQLFLAQTVAASFYGIAFATAVSNLLTAFSISINIIYLSVGSVILFALLAFIGAKFVIRLQYIILVTIILSLISIFLGPSSTPDSLHLFATSSLPISFWIAFAMFFPAVTGIDAGVGMSGDLKNPRKSLVRGTFAAILVTFVVYITLTLKIFSNTSLEVLRTQQFVLHNIAFFPPLVLAGVLLATASSALSCFMSAPRSLKAMTQDNLFSKKMSFLGKGWGKKKQEPRIALFISLCIAIVIMFVGGLNVVSQIVAMFFLNVYGWINGAAFFEKISKNPSYRPTFNAPLVISLYGMIASYLVMYLFNPWIMIGGILFQIIVFFVLSKTKTSIKLENVWDGVLFQLLRQILNRVERNEKSKKNWRPTIMAFCANEVNCSPIASLLDWISSNRSVTKMYYLIQGDLKNTKETADVEKKLRNYAKEHGLDIFVKVVSSTDFGTTFKNIAQSETIGNLPLNTVLIDFDKRFYIDKLLQDSVDLKKNVILLRNQAGFSNFKKVDVWWSKPRSGNFMILLAYLISHSYKWKEENAIIRVFKVVKDDQEYNNEKYRIEKMIEQSRIENVEVHIIRDNNKPLKDIIYDNSQYSDLVLLGLPPSKENKIDDSVVLDIMDYTDKLKTSLVVIANDKIDFRIN